jgi:hypothetical protein
VAIDKKSLALVAMSAIFFSVFGMFLLLAFSGISGWGYEYPFFGSNYIIPTFGIFGLISFCGCVSFLILTRKHSRLWYFGIPLGITLAVILIPTDISHNLSIGLVAIFLLGPCSALFFYSEKRMNNGSMGLVIIAIIASILSAAFLYSMIFPPQYAPGSKTGVGPDATELYFWVYYMLGLPVIGVLFLAHAFGVHHRNSKSGNLPAQKPAEIP